MGVQVPPIYIQGIKCTYRFPGGRLGLGESSDENGPKTTLMFKCAWSDRWSLVQVLMPTCVLGNDGTFTRTPPYALPWNTNLVCTSVGNFEYIGAGADESGDMASEFAVLPANFSCVPWQFVDGDPSGQGDASGEAWTVTKIKPSAEVYQPEGGTYWLGPFPSTTPLDEASVGLLRANVEITVTRKFLPCMYLDALVHLDDSALGSVNETEMTFADTTFDPGFLLLVASEASEPYFDCMGNPVMDQNFVYMGRVAASWQKAQDRTASWQTLNSAKDGSGDEPFDTYDFTKLPR